jgi:hypothetical protein
VKPVISQVDAMFGGYAATIATPKNATLALRQPVGGELLILAEDASIAQSCESFIYR